MARQEARPRFRDLVGTIFLILLVMGLVGAVLWWVITSPYDTPVEEILQTSEARQLVTNGVPESVIRNYDQLGNKLTNDRDTVPVTDSWKVTIEMEPFKSLNGDWTGRRSYLSTEGDHILGVSKGGSSDNFSLGYTTKTGTEEVTPDLRVTLPAFDDSLYHRYVEATANLVVDHPYRHSSDEYKTNKRDLQRTVHLFVVTPQEMKTLTGFFPKERFFSSGILGTIGRWTCALVLAALLVLLCWVQRNAVVEYRRRTR